MQIYLQIRMRPYLLQYIFLCSSAAAFIYYFLITPPDAAFCSIQRRELAARPQLNLKHTRILVPLDVKSERKPK
jgi:hypothetical protein